MRPVLFLGASPVCVVAGGPSSPRQLSIVACGDREKVAGERKQPFPVQTAAARSTFVDQNEQRKDGLNSGGHGEDRRVFAHGGSALCCAASGGFGRVWITVEANSGRDCVRNTCLLLIFAKTV